MVFDQPLFAPPEGSGEQIGRDAVSSQSFT
jgi:hypothetical protein